ncbi:uncharacterized protein [Paramisgurnus dabryanus]|uniref:uncharacterized protein n=1 Tax=Paramisgurnus dabryanus TaxID=90735 RepID=UPI003CCFCC0B
MGVTSETKEPDSFVRGDGRKTLQPVTSETEEPDTFVRGDGRKTLQPVTSETKEPDSFVRGDGRKTSQPVTSETEEPASFVRGDGRKTSQPVTSETEEPASFVRGDGRKTSQPVTSETKEPDSFVRGDGRKTSQPVTSETKEPASFVRGDGRKTLQPVTSETKEPDSFVRGDGRKTSQPVTSETKEPDSFVRGDGRKTSQPVTSETKEPDSFVRGDGRKTSQPVTSETEEPASFVRGDGRKTSQPVTSETKEPDSFVRGDGRKTSQPVTSETKEPDSFVRGDGRKTSQPVTSEIKEPDSFVRGDGRKTSQPVTSETKEPDSFVRGDGRKTSQPVTSETKEPASFVRGDGRKTSQPVTSETEEPDSFVRGDGRKTSQPVTSETEEPDSFVRGDGRKTSQPVTSETKEPDSFVRGDGRKTSQPVTSETKEPDSFVRGVGRKTSQPVTSETEEPASFVRGDGRKTSQPICKHDIILSTVSSLDNCASCSGPYSALKWIGVKCKICSCFWHKSCYNKNVMPYLDSFEPNSEEELFKEDSDKDYVPSSFSEDSESDMVSLELECTKPLSNIDCQESVLVKDSLPEDAVCTAQLKKSCRKGEQVPNKTGIDNIGSEDTTECGEGPSVPSSEISTSGHKNYCYICGKPQSKFTRHLKIHENTNMDVARALALPKHSKERKKLLDKLRNKGNYEHNASVLASGSGQLKLKRKPKKNYNPNDYVNCMYCHAMFLRRELWRHVRNCPSKSGDQEQPGRNKVLALATMSDSVLCQQMSQSVWKLLTPMKDDDISAAVRSDFTILQLAQSFFNKHGQDPSKHDYIRQKLREVGRLLLVLRKQFSLHTIEDAVKPANFEMIIQAVKRVSGYDAAKHTYQTPSLALKLGHSLNKLCDIIHCRALMAEDDARIKSTQTFKKLVNSKWSELVSHGALTTLHEGHFNKPSTLPFTEDVQRLHQHLETVADLATDNLKKTASTKVYGELCRSTLAKIILFNRRRVGEVARMQLKCFLERDTTPLHKDVAVGLTAFEQKLCSHFSRVEIRGKRGRKVAILLSPDMVDALTLLISKRQECGVPQDNTFLFARPRCLTSYRGQDSLRIYAEECGAQNPELLRSTQLRKHVATLSQVLNLKNHELDQVADFLGHDIRVHREYYRLPEATTQLAKISKLLLAMEKGSLTSLQGKSLEEIDIEETLDLTDSSDDSDAEEADQLTQSEIDDDPALESTAAAVYQKSKKKKKSSDRKEHEQAALKRVRRPVEDLPGTSDDDDPALESTAAAVYQKSKKKKKSSNRKEHEQAALKRFRGPVEDLPGTSDDDDPALENTAADDDPALESTSAAVYQKSKKKKSSNRKEHEQAALKRVRRPVEDLPGTSDDDDPALESTAAAFYQKSKKKKSSSSREENEQAVVPVNPAEKKNARRKQKQQWSPTEITAVMRHFKKHITQGKLATKIDCQQCKNAEHPALANRSLQNIRDFVRNRGLTEKRKRQAQNI